MHAPRKCHLDIAFRLLRYLKNCPGKGVCIFKTNSFVLKGFVDADWAKCLSTRRSVTGYLVFFGDSLVSWKSKKQNIVSRSSSESEYSGIGTISCEISFILKLMVGLHVTGITPVNVFLTMNQLLS